MDVMTKMIGQFAIITVMGDKQKVKTDLAHASIPYLLISNGGGDDADLAS